MEKHCRTQLFFSIFAFIGGFLEVFSLVNRGGFSLMQTGNLIYLTIDLIDGKFIEALYYFIIVLSFLGALLTSNVLKNKIRNVDTYRIILMILIIIFIGISMFTPLNLSSSDSSFYIGEKSILNTLANVFLSFAGAFLLDGFSNVFNKNFTATMMTANLNRFISSFFKKNEEENLSLNYGLTILSFLFGVLASYGIEKIIKMGYSLSFNYLDTLVYNSLLLIPVLLILVGLFLYKNIKKEKNS